MKEAKIMSTRQKVHDILEKHPSLINFDKQFIVTFYLLHHNTSDIGEILYCSDDIFTVNRELREYRKIHPELKVKDEVQDGRDLCELANRNVYGR